MNVPIEWLLPSIAECIGRNVIEEGETYGAAHVTAMDGEVWLDLNYDNIKPQTARRLALALLAAAMEAEG
jgi:hypothetical protein